MKRQNPHARSRFPIVGIGASAGGLAAFGDLLAGMPADSGMAFVVVQHLDPNHESLLAEALGRTTPMKVITAANGTVVEPNHVYVIPPNTDIALDGDLLRLETRELSRKPHLAIDHFFRSLAAKPEKPAKVPLEGLRILVVDDDPATLDAISEMLRLNGATVIAVASAAEALQAVRQSKLEVIVSDLAMPGTDGCSLIRTIRALPVADQASVPAIALTAAAGGDGRERSLDAGFQDYLEKPVDIDRLAQAVAEVSRPRHTA